MKKVLKNPGLIQFTTNIIDPGGGGAYVEFPYDTEELFGTNGRIPVMIQFDGEPYRGSMLRMGTERHIIIIVKKIRETICKQAPDLVHVQVQLDDQTREATLSDDVRLALEQAPSAHEQFQKLSYTHQKEYLDWIEDAKKKDTRIRRIEKMVQLLPVKR